MLWSCWLGGRKGIRPVKIEWWGAGMVICMGRGADVHLAQMMTHCVLLQELAHPGSTRQNPESRKTVVVVAVVVILLCFYLLFYYQFRIFFVVYF